MVLSTISGTPPAWATSAIAEISLTTPPGLARLSIKTQRVLSSIAARMFSGSSASTKRVSQPNLRNASPIWLSDPPYSFLAATMLQPGSISVWNAISCAAWPDATPSAPTPPSSAATFFSSASLVGFMMRE